MESMLIALLTAPALLGTTEAIRQGQQKDRREEHRARRTSLIISCSDPSPYSPEIDHRTVCLGNNRLYIRTHAPTTAGGDGMHPFAGYFLPYGVPENAPYEGIVSTITDLEPRLNWIYVDKETYEVKYGLKMQADPNINGPFDCTRQDRRLTLEGWEGFVAVRQERRHKEEEEGGSGGSMDGDAVDGNSEVEWKIYFDRDEDMLEGKLGKGRIVLEVELCRWEKRVRKGRPLGDMR